MLELTKWTIFTKNSNSKFTILNHKDLSGIVGFTVLLIFYFFSVFSYQERKLEDLLNQRKQVCTRSPIILTMKNIAGDKRSPQSLCPGCCYACITLCSQHLFGLLLRMNGMYRTQFGHTHLDPLPLVIWSCMVWTICHVKLRQSTALEQSVWTFDHCRLHSLTFDYH